MDSKPDFEGARKYAEEMLDRETPENKYFHNRDHTQSVHDGVCLLADKEEVGEHDKLMLKTAAAYHDTGRIVSDEGHEQISARIAGEALPEFGYSQQEIEEVQELILATRPPRKPEGTLQRIICDSDFYSIGREDFFEVSDKLRRELNISDMNEWFGIEIEFLENHEYFTDSARRLWNEGKRRNLERYKELLD